MLKVTIEANDVTIVAKLVMFEKIAKINPVLEVILVVVATTATTKAKITMVAVATITTARITILATTEVEEAEEAEAATVEAEVVLTPPGDNLHMAVAPPTTAQVSTGWLHLSWTLAETTARGQGRRNSSCDMGRGEEKLIGTSFPYPIMIVSQLDL